MMFGIDVIAMRFIDRAALKLLRENVNPVTNRVDLTINDLAASLLVSRNTATNITNRLQSAGHIVKHNKGGRCGAEIEICSEKGER